jgi:hypothetical protein
MVASMGVKRGAGGMSSLANCVPSSATSAGAGGAVFAADSEDFAASGASLEEIETLVADADSTGWSGLLDVFSARTRTLEKPAGTNKAMNNRHPIPRQLSRTITASLHETQNGLEKPS